MWAAVSCLCALKASLGSRYSRRVSFRRFGPRWLLWAALVPSAALAYGSNQGAPALQDFGPYAAEIRDGTYHNYFFGLRYGIPDGWQPNPVFHVSGNDSELNLLLLGARRDLGEISFLLLRAQPLSGLGPQAYLERVRNQEHLGKFKRFTAAGQEFFRADEDAIGSRHRVFLACFRRDYALIFIVRTSESAAQHAERLVSSAVFSDLKMPSAFDALLRQRIALRDAPAHGGVSGSAYHNDLIGLTYLFPQGWSPVQRPQMQSVLAWMNQGFAERPQPSAGALPALQYLFEAVAPPHSDASSVLVFTVDLLPAPEIRTPLDALGAVNLVFGHDGQHSRTARVGAIGGREFAAQKIVLSGRDANDIFVNAFVGNFVTLLGRTALVFMFRSASETALYRATASVNSLHFERGSALLPSAPAGIR